MAASAFLWADYAGGGGALTCRIRCDKASVGELLVSSLGHEAGGDQLHRRAIDVRSGDESDGENGRGLFPNASQPFAIAACGFLTNFSHPSQRLTWPEALTMLGWRHPK